MVATGPDSEVDVLLAVSQVLSWLNDVLSLKMRGGLLKALCERTQRISKEVLAACYRNLSQSPSVPGECLVMKL